MNFWEFLSDQREQLLHDAYQHASAVFQCMVVAVVLGVGLAVATYRNNRASSLAVSTTAVILTIPSLALLGLLVPWLGLGVPPTVVSLVLYALLPIVRNAVVGLRGVDPAMVDAARGIGMTRAAVLARVELPIAWPVILTGIRISVQMIMGIAAIAAYVSGPGLGNEIFNGLSRLGGANSLNLTLSGTLGVVVLALLFDAALVLLGRLTTSRGIRV